MTKISYFSRASDTKPVTINLDSWLKDTINPSLELKEQVEDYRHLKNKKLKTKIPAVTISATFKKKRDLNFIKSKNNFIVLDIDRYAKSKKATCNLCIDMDRVKELFKQIPACYYVGYSVSSDGEKVKDGMYAVIKLKKGTTLKKAFNYFKTKLSRIGINIDESCKDYSRLRFFSYDPKAYYNPKAKSFSIPKKRKLKSSSTGYASKSDQEKVELVVGLIESNGIDITSDYEDWYKIAGSLYNAFGENGRSYFHRISKFYSEYSEKETNKKFSNCTNMRKVSLSSFFHVATKHGIRY